MALRVFWACSFRGSGLGTENLSISNLILLKNEHRFDERLSLHFFHVPAVFLLLILLGELCHFPNNQASLYEGNPNISLVLATCVQIKQVPQWFPACY